MDCVTLSHSLMIIQDASRFTYPREFRGPKISLKSSKKIGTLRKDNSGEYKSTEFEYYLKRKG